MCLEMARRMHDSFRPAEAGEKIGEEKKMNNLFLAMYVKLNNLMKHEEGQDLIEYALIAALIAVATIAGMSKIATAVNGLFSNISSSLA
jgi:pilus assembly protein Flp/PilA